MTKFLQLWRKNCEKKKLHIIFFFFININVIQIQNIITDYGRYDLFEHNWKDFSSDRFIKENSMNDITYNKLIFSYFFNFNLQMQFVDKI